MSTHTSGSDTRNAEESLFVLHDPLENSLFSNKTARLVSIVSQARLSPRESIVHGESLVRVWPARLARRLVELLELRLTADLSPAIWAQWGV